MKIITDVECDNAPKKKYIVDFTIALAEQRLEDIAPMLSDSFIWHFVGKSQITSVSLLPALLTEQLGKTTQELRIEHALSHGKLCAINGTFLGEDGLLAFNDIYEFESHGKTAKIKSIKSYWMKLG